MKVVKSEHNFEKMVKNSQNCKFFKWEIIKYRPSFAKMEEHQKPTELMEKYFSTFRVSLIIKGKWKSIIKHLSYWSKILSKLGHLWRDEIYLCTNFSKNQEYFDFIYFWEISFSPCASPVRGVETFPKFHRWPLSLG